jgi:hypothetical protein
MFDDSAVKNTILDQLDYVNWKTELKTTGKYIPKNPKNNKQVFFNLERLINDFMLNKPDFSLSLGSETAPPCRGKSNIIINRLCVSLCCFYSFKDKLRTI